MSGRVGHFDPVQMPTRAVLGADPVGEGLAEIALVIDPQQHRRNQIDPRNQPVGGDGQIADRRRFIQVGIALVGGFEGHPGLLQGLVLHFQFDLMNLEFMQQGQILVGRLFLSKRKTGLGLGAGAQFTQAVLH